MGNKEIQEQRMKGYFIEATKDILRGEGLKNISVRNIAERAGYSYATLYNYFSDVKDLIFECVIDFQEECEVFIKFETKKTQPGIEKIKAVAKAYMKYFIQYTGIFELFFLEKTSDLARKQNTAELIYTFFDKACVEEWDYCIQNKIIKKTDAELMKPAVKYLITGMLLFYINRRQPASYKEFTELAEIQLNNILKIKKL